MSKLNELINRYCSNGVEFKKLKEVVLLNRHKQIGAIELEKLKVNCGEIKLLPSSRNYDWFTSKAVVEDNKLNQYLHNGRVITVGRARNANTKYFDGEWISSQNNLIESADENILNTKFLYYFISAHDKEFYTTEGSYPLFTKDVFLGLSIPVPPLPVQEEIVRILDKFTELEAELEAELAHRKQQYAFYRDQLLNFGTSASAELIPLSELAQFTYGYTDVAKETGDTRFIRITDISDDGCLNPDNAKFITLSDESKKYLLKEGDLLLARTGATYGKTLYVPDNRQSIYASFLIKISLDNSKILNRYYWHFSKSNLYWSQAEKYVSKGGQQQFNANAVGRVLVPVPSIEVQQKLVKILDNFDTICSDLSIGLPAEIAAREKQYNYYRDLLFNYAAGLAGFKQSTAEHSRAQQSTAEQKLIAYVFGPRKCA